MVTIDTTRRDFLRGAMASAGIISCCGGRLFAVPHGWTPSKKKPNLVFGVMADTHMRVHYDGVRFYEHNGTEMGDTAVTAVLKYLKDENADAVVHCGDLTDRGMIREMEFYKEAWDKVFKRGPRPVNLYATGNHDVEDGFDYWAKGIVHSKDPAVVNKIRLGPNLKAAMERIWGQPYEDVWHNKVKGYHFFGMGWGVNPDDNSPVYHGNLYHDSPMEGKKCSRFIHKGLLMAELVRREREEGGLDPMKPFFTVYHCNIDRYDRRKGIINSHLASALGMAPGKFCNGLGFFGHGHRSNADWHFFWDNKAVFPSIECASLAYWKDRYGEGKKPLFAKGFGDDTAEGEDNRTHALLVKVYDDAVVLRRLWVEVKPKTRLASLGTDLVMPLSEFAPLKHPFQLANLKNFDAKPEFPKNAKLEVSMVKEVLSLRIPRASGNGNVRVYGYNVVIAGPDGSTNLYKNVYAKGYSYGDGYEPDHGVTTVSFPKGRLPVGKTLTITVHPCSCFASKGKPLVVAYSTVTGTAKPIKVNNI